MLSSGCAEGCAARDVADLGPGGSTHDRAEPPDVVWRDLLGESARAELDIAGPFIDFGTADQHKYTRGGWATGWGASERERDGTTYAQVIDAHAQLFVMAHRRSRAIAIRVRARATEQRLEVYWDGVRLPRSDGDPRASIAQSWQVVRFAVPERLATPGRHRVLLSSGVPRPVHRQAGRPARVARRAAARSGLRERSRDWAVELDWLWVATHPRRSPPGDVARTGPLRVGERVHRALLAPGSRRYSFYLHGPERGRLVFEYGSDQRVEFTVVAHTADGERHLLFRRASTPGRWSSATVDMGRFSGQAIRLDLATEGPGGRTGWGAPVIRGARRATRRSSEGRKPPKNVILVVHDTSRADLFGPFHTPGTGETETPHFDALAATATTFTAAYNNESWTRPSTISILTGLYPATHGAMYARSVLSDEIELLSEHLGQQGFRTAGLVGNPVLRADFGLDQGWDEYRTYGREANRGARVYGDAVRWISRHHQRGRFFLYVHGHDSHTPYRPERRYSALYHPEHYNGFIGKAFDSKEQYAVGQGLVPASDSDLAWIRALYRGEATYQDEHFGRLMTRLDALGVLDDTLIVVTNDHGEEFREHGGMGHGRTLYDEQLRAPLIMRHPGIFPAGARISRIVEHVDVAPTIVEALDLPPLAGIDGLSLLPAITGRGEPPRPYSAVAALRHNRRAIRVGRWKLIVDREVAGDHARATDWRALHDLAVDPGESRDLRASHVIAGRLCEIYLAEALASPAKRHRLGDIAVQQRFRATTLEIDGKTRRELEALGYVGDDGFER